MPEIEIGRGYDSGKPEFVFQLLKGEDLTTLRKTSVLVSIANSYVSSYVKAPDAYGAGEKIEKAKETLAQLLPYEVSEKLIKALLDQKIGAKVSFIFTGKTEREGFTLESVEIPEE